MTWLYVAVIWVLIIVAVVYGDDMAKNFPKTGEKKTVNVVAYDVDDLRLTVYYDRAERRATADFRDYDKYGRVYITCFVMEPVQNEIQRQYQGVSTPAGKAIVRVVEGTDDVVSWTYVK